MQTLTIKCDGGSRSNPGPAACAFAVWDGKDLVYRQGVYLGTATNNQAEYKAVLSSLQWLEKQNQLPTSVTWKLDSMLVVEQVNGNWKVKDFKLRVLRDHCLEALHALEEKGVSWSFTHIPRGENQVADDLVNETLDLHAQKAMHLKK